MKCRFETNPERQHTPCIAPSRARGIRAAEEDMVYEQCQVHRVGNTIAVEIGARLRGRRNRSPEINDINQQGEINSVPKSIVVEIAD